MRYPRKSGAGRDRRDPVDRPLSRSASILAAGRLSVHNIETRNRLGLQRSVFSRSTNLLTPFFPQRLPLLPSSRGKGCCRTHRDGGSCWRQSRRTCGTLWRAGGRSVLARGLVGQELQPPLQRLPSTSPVREKKIRAGVHSCCYKSLVACRRRGIG